jgi:hypothetical protein
MGLSRIATAIVHQARRWRKGYGAWAKTNISAFNEERGGNVVVDIVKI